MKLNLEHLQRFFLRRKVWPLGMAISCDDINYGGTIYLYDLLNQSKTEFFDLEALSKDDWEYTYLVNSKWINSDTPPNKTEYTNKQYTEVIL